MDSPQASRLPRQRQVRTLPDWRFVRGLTESYRHAQDHGRFSKRARHSGLDEYGRPRHAVLEHAFSQPRISRDPVALALLDGLRGVGRPS